MKQKPLPKIVNLETTVKQLIEQYVNEIAEMENKIHDQKNMIEYLRYDLEQANKKNNEVVVVKENEVKNIIGFHVDKLLSDLKKYF
jgi:flagellar biosynthesis component FlhA